ncbi:MAG: DUF262 domain-containing protein [Flavobacteriaceae bacterium]
MADLLYNIENLFGNYIKDKKFNIPEYQRGYKWNGQQIKQLLNDIYRFHKTKSENNFY